MKKVVAIGELLIDFVPQQKGCALDELQHIPRFLSVRYLNLW